MILIADSGSTKTDWILLDNNEKQTIETRGINPYFNTNEVMAEVISTSALSAYFNAINEVHFYGAGLATDEIKSQMQRMLSEVFNRAGNVQVYDDLMATARALFQNKAGIACILGTGSNSCFYDGTIVADKVPALGYLLGDEGSGAYIGKSFFNALFKRSLPADLTAEIIEKHHIVYAEVLENVYKKPLPNKYLASFTRVLKEYESHAPIKAIVANAFNDFIRKNINRYPNAQELPVGFVGSVAYYFKEILEEQLQKNDLKLHKIIKAPADHLVAYHSSSKTNI